LLKQQNEFGKKQRESQGNKKRFFVIKQGTKAQLSDAAGLFTFFNSPQSHGLI